jgi:hypothetical protein
MSDSYLHPSQKWKRWRRKDDTADDPSWVSLFQDPNALTITVGGTTDDGVYSITVDPQDPRQPHLASVTNEFDRQAAETDAQIATALEALIAADIAAGGSLFDYFSDSSVAGEVITLVVKPTAPPFVITLVDPGTATLTIAPDDVFPITRQIVPHRGAEKRVTALDVCFVPVDSSNVPVDDDNAMTLTAQFVDQVTRATHWEPTLVTTVRASAESTGLSIQSSLRIPVHGSEAFGIRLSALTNTPTGYDALEVWYREVDV